MECLPHVRPALEARLGSVTLTLPGGTAATVTY